MGKSQPFLEVKSTLGGLMVTTPWCVKFGLQRKLLALGPTVFSG